MSVPLALFDFIPVILFAASVVIVQRGLYGEMSKGAFALLAAGTIMTITAGFMKAAWKLLYALGICDFERLNQCYFPMQSVGFLLAGVSIVALLFFKQKRTTALMSVGAPAVFAGTMVFVVPAIVGCLGYCGGLALYAKRQGKKLAAVLFLVTFVFMLAMGYLSSQDFTAASMHWIAEGVNFAGELTLLIASIELFKNQNA